MTARSDAQGAQERVPASVFEADLDTCLNVFGVSPCTAGRVNSGTLQVGGTTVVRLATSASTADDFYNGMTLRSTGGTGSGQERKIVDYVGATRDATVSVAFSPALDGTTTYDVIDRPNGCYNVFSGPSPCQDKPNYVKGMKTVKFCSRGMPIPGGEQIRPYLLKSAPAPTEISTAKGLAARSKTTITFTDEPTGFDDLDKYAADRIAVAGGTYWLRLIARNPNYGGRFARLRRGYVVRRALSLPGIVGNYASTPDSAAVSITGDIDIRVKAAATDWTPSAFRHFAAKRPGTGQDSWLFRFHTTNVLEFDWTEDGSTFKQALSTAAPVVADGATKWLRVTLDVNNGAAGRDIKFYTSDDGTTWTQLGSTVTQAGTTSIFDGNGAVTIGHNSGEAFAGKAYYFELRNGIDGPVVANFNAGKFAVGGLNAVASTGETWTINQSGSPKAEIIEDDGAFFDTFQTELYIIESIKGPDRSGNVMVNVADAVKLLDRRTVPAQTDGKLVSDLKGVSNDGFARGGGASTIVLAEKAESIDDFYNGHEVFIFANRGSGQRRVISDYDGASRTATVASAWAEIPDTTSAYEVTPLQFTVPSGKGAQYQVPGAEPEFVRIGEEVIRYTAKSTDTLSWLDGTYRAQFGTARNDHKANDSVTLCRAWINKPPSTVIRNIINEGGLADTYIDLAGLAVEEADWLHTVLITACIADPVKAGELLADLLKDLTLMTWWHPVEQKVKFKADMPELAVPSKSLTDDALMLEKTEVDPLDAERITRAVVDFDLNSATADRAKRQNYRTIEAFIEGVAESPNDHGDVRQDLRQSRWLTAANELLARANAARKVRRLRDAPKKVKHQLDPKDELMLGQLADLTTRKIVDAAGNPRTVRVRVMRLIDRGSHYELEARTTNFADKRYGFIAPSGYPDYPSATSEQRRRAFISNGATMSDGTSAYLIS